MGIYSHTGFMELECVEQPMCLFNTDVKHVVGPGTEHTCEVGKQLLNTTLTVLGALHCKHCPATSFCFRAMSILSIVHCVVIVQSACIPESVCEGPPPLDPPLCDCVTCYSQ